MWVRLWVRIALQCQRNTDHKHSNHKSYSTAIKGHILPPSQFLHKSLCSIVHIYYGRIPLQPDFFLPLIKPIFQHQHVKPVNIRLAILILNMSASIKNKPNRHRLILFPIKNAPNPLPTSNTDDCIF